jgi:hypothetical protein
MDEEARNRDVKTRSSLDPINGAGDRACRNSSQRSVSEFVRESEGARAAETLRSQARFSPNIKDAISDYRTAASRRANPRYNQRKFSRFEASRRRRATLMRPPRLVRTPVNAAISSMAQILQLAASRLLLMPDKICCRTEGQGCGGAQPAFSRKKFA